MVGRSALTVAAVVVLTTAAAGQTRRPAGDEWELVKPLFKIVEDVASGSPAPADVRLKWICHFIDAEAGVVFVPFTLAVDNSGFTASPIGMYVRVVMRGAPAPAPGPRDALAQYPFEDAAVLDRPRDGRITRAFAAPPGDYDVYVALREKPAADGSTPKTAVIKQPVNVPDLKSALSVSSIIVADRIDVDPSGRRLNFEEQLDEPYVWWGTRITPALRDTFGRREKLMFTFAIYNAGAAAGDKPDVDVNYRVYRKASGADTLIGGTRPEVFNAHTLPREFRLAAGDLLVGGQQVALAGFADGVYRLEISVRDNTNGQQITRTVNFTVAGE